MNMKKLIYWTGATLLAALTIASCAPKQNTLTSKEEAEGWQLSEITHDLHANGPIGVMTDYEAKFYEQGMRINRLVATRTADSRSLSRDGAVPRLRNASLTDARGYEESQEANRRNNA